MWWFVNDPLQPNSTIGGIAQTLNGTWNLNNFQTQSPNYIYSSSISGLALDTDGMQVIINIANDDDNVVYATIINAYKPRGSPEYFYQESQEYDYYDDYQQIGNSANVFLSDGGSGQPPSCDVGYVPWNAIFPPSNPFIVSCTGLAQIQSTYGDNRIFDYANTTEGNMINALTIYTMQFTALAGTRFDQVSIDVLNNVQIKQFVQATFGLYGPDGTLLSSNPRVVFLELLDQMIVVDIPSITTTTSGLYTLAFQVDTPIAVAISNTLGPVATATSFGLPSTFTATGTAPLLPLTAYGCVQASHYFCASFQYYQGDNYFPITYDYLYQGLLLTQDVADASNSYGTYKPVLYGVGHLTLYARIARYAFQFLIGFTDLLLTMPGTASGDVTNNVVYSVSGNGQPLDSYGLSFLTNDDYGYQFSLLWNSSKNGGSYQDSTNAELGAELLTTVTVKPIDMRVGVPQCSWLDLPSVVYPNITGNFTCSAPTQTVLWGDDVTDDYFYNAEGLYTNDMNLIVLSPFNTGPGDYSTITQLALAINQNGNVFAHIRMALYDNNNMLLATSNEVAVDNARDAILYFTLDKPVLLTPASVYWGAYWSDVAFYSTASQDFFAGKCYYNLTAGYDNQPWPSTIGSVEAEYYECYPLPVAALGCSTPNIVPPPVPPICPPTNSTDGAADGKRYSTVTVFVVGFLALAVGIICTLLGVKVYNSGNCPSFIGRGSGSGSGSGSGPLSSHGDEAATSSSRYSSLSDE